MSKQRFKEVAGSFVCLCGLVAAMTGLAWLATLSGEPLPLTVQQRDMELRIIAEIETLRKIGFALGDAYCVAARSSVVTPANPDTVLRRTQAEPSK